MNRFVSVISAVSAVFTLFCISPLLNFTYVEAQSQISVGNSNIIPNEFVVRFKPNADPRLNKSNPDVAALAAIEDNAGVITAKALSSLDHTYIYHTDGTLSRQATLRVFDNAQAVESVEPDRLLSLLTTPNDTDFQKQWALKNIQADKAWDYERGSVVTKVAVIDSGCEATHSDLDINIVETKVFDDPQMMSEHGTHVCGIIGGLGNNTRGITGINWSIGIMALKADAIVNGQYGLRMSKVADAVVYAADNGARVINLSLGGSASDVLKDAIDYAEQKGVIIVAAAGNNASQNYNLYPAAWPSVVSVSAVGPQDEFAFYSSFGKVDLSAPGGVVSQDRNGDGLKNAKDCVDAECIYSTSLNNGYANLAGTSMAAPFVSGTAALLISAKPQLTKDEVITALESSADDLGDAGKDIKFGYGRINALKALQGIGAQPYSEPTTEPQPTSSTDSDHDTSGDAHPCVLQAEKGDYNCDSTISMSDFTTWRRDFMQNVAYASLILFEQLRNALLH